MQICNSVINDTVSNNLNVRSISEVRFDVAVFSTTDIIISYSKKKNICLVVLPIRRAFELGP